MKIYLQILICLLITFSGVNLFAQNAPRTLLDGQSNTRELSLDEIHRYSLELRKGELAFLSLKDFTINVRSTVLNRDDYVVEETETWGGASFLIFYAREKGKYAIEIKPYNRDKTKGNYTLKTDIIRVKNGDKIKLIDKVLARFYSADKPGASIAVIKKGRVLYKKSFGRANLDYSIPNTSSTPFDLASVSKQFTAFSIAMLADKGILSLNDDIRKFIPELPVYEKKITIRNLIGHTGGLYENDGGLALAGYDSEDYTSKERELAFMSRNSKVIFKAGERLQYSNAGYTLLGEIIYRVTGKPLSRWAKENIFIPLRMQNTAIRDDLNEVMKNRAVSYLKGKNGIYKKSPINFTATGACCVTTSIDDLAKWINNFRNGEVGGNNVLRIIKQKGMLNNGKETDYAFGNWITKIKGLNRISHLGLSAGFRTSLSRFPDHGVSIIFLANDGEWRTYYLARKVRDIYFADYLEFKKKSPSLPKDTSLENKTLRKSTFDKKTVNLSDYSGVFYAKDIVTSYVFITRNGKLFAESVKYEPILLKPIEDNVFSGSKWFFNKVRFIRKNNSVIGCDIYNDRDGTSIHFDKLK